jgi:ABC-2 type transport system permease protein
MYNANNKNDFIYINFMTIYALFYRELIKTLKDKKRFISIIMQPMIIWMIMGIGFNDNFKISLAIDMNYKTYFYPGILSMILLFSAIFSTITLIDDKNCGFLQIVLVGPANRFSVVLGKTLGVTCVSIFQSVIFLFLVPFTSIKFSDINFCILFVALFFGSFFLSNLGFILAWITSSSSTYHALMSVIFFPMWAISGALFPVKGGLIDLISYINPVTWIVFLIRISFIKFDYIQKAVPSWLSLELSIFLLVTISIGCFFCATFVCYKYR